MNQLRSEDHAERADRAYDDNQGGRHQVCQARGGLLAAIGEIFGEGGNERARERAFGKKIAGQVGNAEAQHEGVVDQAGAEQAGHHAFAQQAGDAAHQDGDGNDACRADDAFALSRGRAAASGLGSRHASRRPRHCPYCSKKWAIVMIPA